MEILARIWEFIGLLFGGLLKTFERGITSLFGSSNARYVRRLQATVVAVNSLESKYQAMSDAELREQTTNSESGCERARRWTICWSRRLRFAAKAAAASSACAITMCS
jgi:predicted adenine nucleotide alpha hydrolase (AANH) superfamily ATPase